MRLIARPLLQALLLSILVPTASAETYSVGVESIDYYPLYAEKDGKYIGLAQEILDKFAQKAGHQFQYKPFPVIRLTKTYLTEKAWISNSLIMSTGPRKKNRAFPSPTATPSWITPMA